MSNWKEQFLEWLELPRNRSRLIASVIGLFVLFGAVFFSTQIGNLFSLFGSKAGISPEQLEITWEEVEGSGGEARMHGKLFAEESGRWLYALGGMEKQYDTIVGQYDITLLNTVERIAIDEKTGDILSGAVWEPMPSMNFGHAEFSVIQFGQYLYVIGGDIHIPPDNKEGYYPLLYSTIERLDLNAETPSWEVTALLSGVNFYTEAIVYNEKIQVVGGVYGNPFPPLPGMTAEKQRLDILDNHNDNWSSLRLADKPVFGNVGIYVPIGYEYSDIAEGSFPDPINAASIAFNINVDTSSTKPVVVDSKVTSNKSTNFVSVAQAQGADDLPTINIPTVGFEKEIGDLVTVVWGEPNFYPLPALNTYNDTIPYRVYIPELGESSVQSIWIKRQNTQDDWKLVGKQITAAKMFTFTLDHNTFSPDVYENYNIDLRVCAENPIGVRRVVGQDSDYGNTGTPGTFVRNIRKHYFWNWFVGDATSDCGGDIAYPEGAEQYYFDETYFKIVPPAEEEPFVRIISPVQVGDNYLQTNERQDIVWESRNGRNGNAGLAPDYISIWYSPMPGVGGIEYNKVANVVRNKTWGTNTYVWTVGEVLGGFSDIDGRSVTGSIIFCAAGATTVCPNPYAGTQFSVRGDFWIESLATDKQIYDDDSSEPIIITWDSHGYNAKIELEYKMGNDVWRRFANGISAYKKEFIWHGTPAVANGIQNDTVFIRAWINKLGVRKDYDDTAPVTLNNPDWNKDNLEIKFSAPAAGTVLDPGSEYEIRFSTYNSAGITTAVATYISYDGGDTDEFLCLAVVPRPNPPTAGDIICDITVLDVFSENVVLRATYFHEARNETVTFFSPQFIIRGQDLSKKLSEAVTGGSFVTTVGEHIAITPSYIDTEGNVVAESAVSGELGNDTSGTPKSVWTINQTSKLGHLRFLYSTGRFIPAPQGRYGHKLVVFHIPGLINRPNPYRMYVLGGATWSNEYTQGVSGGSTYHFKNFWVIEDKLHPYFDDSFSPPISGSLPFINYGTNSKFYGNIAMRYLGISGGQMGWSGNWDNDVKAKTFKDHNDRSLTEGRAFFTLKSYTIYGTDNDYVVVGGLKNTQAQLEIVDDKLWDFSASADNYYVRSLITSTADTEIWKDNKWNAETPFRNTSVESIPTPRYNMASAGLDGGVVITGGQKDFQYSSEKTKSRGQGQGLPIPTDDFINHDPHVPIYPGSINDIGFMFAFSANTTMYVPVDSPTEYPWHVMREVTTVDIPSFAATALTAVNLEDNPSRVFFQYGGLEINDTSTHIASDSLFALGPFDANIPVSGDLTIDPDKSPQGVASFDVVLTGTNSHFNSTTQIFWERPSQLVAGTGGGSNIVVAVPNNLKEINATLRNPDGSPVSGVDIDFAIKDGAGGFYHDGSRTKRDSTDDAGVAKVLYRPESAGIIEIEVSTSDVRFSHLEPATVWLRAIEEVTAYSLIILDRNPTAVGGNDRPQTSTIKAAIYEYNPDGAPINITAGKTFEFISTNGGSFSQSNNSFCDFEGEDCVDIVYTPDGEMGMTNIIAHTVVNNNFVSDSKQIFKYASPSSDTDILVNDIIIESPTEINMNMTVGTEAPIGIWRIIVSSITRTEDTDFEYTEVLATTFEVTSGELTGARLESVAPKRSIPDNTFTISIVGVETNFDASDENERTSLYLEKSSINWNQGGTTEIVIPSTLVTVDDFTHLTAEVTIPPDAVIGFWEVSVITVQGANRTEVANLPGYYDFIVGSESGYTIAMTATPSEIVGRGDGQTSTVDGVLRLLDNDTGQNNPVPNKTLDIAFVDIDEQGGLSVETVTTGNQGGFSFIYTIDDMPLGTPPTEAVIQASYNDADNGIFEVGLVTIYKIDNPYKFDLKIYDPALGTRNNEDAFVLSKDMVIVPGNENKDQLRAILTDPDGTIISNNDVTFLVSSGGGSFVPVTSTTDANGLAWSNYLADVTSGLVTIRARAHVPNFGWLSSNSVTINKTNVGIGDYIFTWVADKTVVEAGGQDTATLTATITEASSGDRIPGWGIVFDLINEQSGDVLSNYGGITNGQGIKETIFTAGNQTGQLIVIAYPEGLPSENITITKTAVSDVGYRHISASPYRVPNNGVAYSTVTVSVKNANGIAIAGVSVTVSTTNLSDILTDNIGAPLDQNSSLLTNVGGRVTFRVSSNDEHKTVAEATVAGTKVTAPISFEANLITITSFDIKVPVEANSYDYDLSANPGIWLAIHENNPQSSEPLEINDAYALNSSSQILEGMPSPFYLRQNTTYDIWVKGKNHLGRIREFTTPSAETTTIDVDFVALKAADIGPPTNQSTNKLTPWHDNTINSIDLSILLNFWKLPSSLANIDDRDNEVNGFDLFYWIRNFGNGSPKPAP